MKIEQVEPQFAQKLNGPLKQILQEFQYFVPDNYRSQVSLLKLSGNKWRRVRSNASTDNWSPESGRIEIRFEPARSAQKRVESAEKSGELKGISTSSIKLETPSNSTVPSTSAHPVDPDVLKILIQALDRAESKPGWKFVPLKKFRDEVLPYENNLSLSTDADRQHVLKSAIDKRLIILGRVPNPKAPEFPVTTIRVNRLMPEVKLILGTTTGNSDLDFRPVEIKGEPLSATIARERQRN